MSLDTDITNKKILNAIKDNNFKELGSIILEDKKVLYYKDEKGNNLLHLGILSGYESLVKNIINAYGASSFDDINNDGFFPISLAIKTKKINIVKLLIENNSRVVSKINNDSSSQLMLAVKYSEEICLLLIKNGISLSYINTKDNNSELIFALKNKKYSIAEKIINSGYGLSHRDEFGKSALNYCVDDNQEELALLMIKNGAKLNDVNEKTKDSELIYAIKNKSYRIARRIISTGYGLSLIDSDYKSALNYCVDFDLPELAGLLIKSGASLSSYNSNLNTTELLYALKNNSTEIAQKIIETGYSVNTPDNLDKNPLNYCIDYGYLSLASSLIKAGAKLSYVNEKTGDTHLIHAIKNKKFDIAEKIISTGSSINQLNYSGESALLLSMSMGNELLAIKLVNAGASLGSLMNGKNLLSLAFEMNLENLANTMIDKGSANNVLDVEQNMPLSYAMLHGSYENVRKLIKNSNVRNRITKYDYPIMWAINCNRLDLIIPLLNTSSPINIYDEYGNHAFKLIYEQDKELAEKTFSLGLSLSYSIDNEDNFLTYAIKQKDMKLVNKLLNNSADIYQANKDGKTPYELLIENNLDNNKIKSAYEYSPSKKNTFRNTSEQSMTTFKKGNNFFVKSIVKIVKDIRLPDSIKDNVDIKKQEPTKTFNPERVKQKIMKML